MRAKGSSNRRALSQTPRSALSTLPRFGSRAPHGREPRSSLALFGSHVSFCAAGIRSEAASISRRMNVWPDHWILVGQAGNLHEAISRVLSSNFRADSPFKPQKQRSHTGARCERPRRADHRTGGCGVDAPLTGALPLYEWVVLLGDMRAVPRAVLFLSSPCRSLRFRSSSYWLRAPEK